MESDVIAFIMSGKMPFMPSQNSFSIFVIVIPFDLPIKSYEQKLH
jgi:hypothetical protein